MRVARLNIVRLFLAIVVAANLLHAPSLAVAADNTGVDCAAMMAETHDHHSTPTGTGDESDRARHASTCPFANASAPLVAAPDAPPVSFSVSRPRLDAGETLIAADIAPEDPPPRAVS